MGVGVGAGVGAGAGAGVGVGVGAEVGVGVRLVGELSEKMTAYCKNVILHALHFVCCCSAVRHGIGVFDFFCKELLKCEHCRVQELGGNI